jgi:SAM-dependent methyltransferase
MDAKTEELRAAHDVLAEFYADRLADALDHMPADRAMLGLFCNVTLAAGLGTSVADVGCGTGRLVPYLAAKGLSPCGVDLSPEMVRVARHDHPGFAFDVADLRGLPFGDASLAASPAANTSPAHSAPPRSCGGRAGHSHGVVSAGPCHCV